MFTSLNPDPPLSQWVEVIWDCDGFSSSHRRELRLPTPGAELVFNLEDIPLRFAELGSPHAAQSPEAATLDGATRFASLSGPHTRPFVLDTSRPLLALGVHLKPIALASLFRLNAAELRDRHVPFEQLPGVDHLNMWCRLREATTAARRIQIVADWLLARQRNSREPHRAVQPALQLLCRGTGSVRRIADAAGLSERRLNTVVSEQTGLGPKTYMRLCRFQKALNGIGGAAADWSRLAVDAGYCDQSHLIREFRDFSGLTPAAYVRRKTGHANHVALAAPATMSDLSNR